MPPLNCYGSIGLSFRQIGIWRTEDLHISHACGRRTKNKRLEFLLLPLITLIYFLHLGRYSANSRTKNSAAPIL